MLALRYGSVPDWPPAALTVLHRTRYTEGTGTASTATPDLYAWLLEDFHYKQDDLVVPHLD